EDQNHAVENLRLFAACGFFCARCVAIGFHTLSFDGSLELFNAGFAGAGGGAGVRGGGDGKGGYAGARRAALRSSPAGGTVVCGADRLGQNSFGAIARSNAAGTGAQIGLYQLPATRPGYRSAVESPRTNGRRILAYVCAYPRAANAVLSHRLRRD